MSWISKKLNDYKERQVQKEELRKQEEERQFKENVKSIIENAQELSNEFNISTTEALQIMSIISLEKLEQDVEKTYRAAVCSGGVTVVDRNN